MTENLKGLIRIAKEQRYNQDDISAVMGKSKRTLTYFLNGRNPRDIEIMHEKLEAFLIEHAGKIKEKSDRENRELMDAIYLFNKDNICNSKYTKKEV